MKKTFKFLLGDMLIDKYQYSQTYDRDKINYYQNHSYTKEEKEKEESLRNKIIDFETKVRGKETIKELLNNPDHPEWRIKYLEEKGFISFSNTDRDIVEVYFYGKTENEAFINAIVSHELILSESYEYHNKSKISVEYDNSISEESILDEDYQIPFFFSEIVLEDFKKYFGEEIPKSIIENYENHIKNIYDEEFKYDISKNKLVKKEKNRQI